MFHMGKKCEVELLLQRITICDMILTQDTEQKLERPQKIFWGLLSDIDCPRLPRTRLLKEVSFSQVASWNSNSNCNICNCNQISENDHAWNNWNMWTIMTWSFGLLAGVKINWLYESDLTAIVTYSAAVQRINSFLAGIP